MKWSDGGSGAVNTVVTTGIYCRAGCAGRPNPNNTARMRSPAEAEAAGYRACLRCRPDRLPVVPIDANTDAVVAAALVLIGDGFLDRHTEDELGRNVGASARHLRRLFAEAVGATPTQVASSRRAHFARALLDDTDLSVTEVAFAAGFGSVRTMNQVVRSTFKASPTELRRRRRGLGSAIDGGLALTLRAHRPIDADQLLGRLAEQAIPMVESVMGGVYRRSTNVCGHGGIVEISIPDPHAVRVVAHLPAMTGLIDEVARCRRLLQLDRVDSEPPGVWSEYEAEVRDAVEGSSVGWSALVERFGAPVRGVETFGIEREFPTPGDVRSLTADVVGGDRRLVDRLADIGERWELRQW